MPPIDAGQAADFIQTVGFPVTVAVVAIVLSTLLIWILHKVHVAEVERMGASHGAELVRIAAERQRDQADHERELRDKEAGAQAWKQMYEMANAERQANGRELAEQLRTLDIALELLHRTSPK